ncbi:hypothetical protein GW17_00025686 [Ensete ventricosum]|nr:hypothetical protein GW17_00025686 [Ensete ventricosum]
MDDRVFGIPRRDRNSTPWSIRTFSSTWKGYVRRMCNKYDTSLDLEGCSGDCIGEESQSSKCICGGITRHKLFSKTE